MVYFCVMWMNIAPKKLGISQAFYPREIMTCRKLNWKKPCKALFGSYLEAHEDPVVTNGMKGRRFDYLFLGPTANRQGTSNFFDLITGKVKKPRTITKYPMPNRIIKLANGWGLRFQKEENK